MPFLSYWALRICFLTHLILCPSFLSVLSCLFRFCHSVGIAISFQKIFSLCSAQGLLSCSVQYFLTFPSVISFLFRPSCPVVSLLSCLSCLCFHEQPLHSLHCLYSLPGTLLKGLLTFNPYPVPCCPSCLLSCLSQLIYSAKELYPNTRCNIIVLVFIFEFCKLILLCHWLF
jgi:hypothetical protein